MQKLIAIIAAIAIISSLAGVYSVKAASIADSKQMGIQPNDNNNGAIASAGGSDNNNTESQSMVLTAVPDRGEIAKGSTQSIIVRATTNNGTAIPDANIASMVVAYGNTTQRILLGGQTDDKGEVKLSTAIGPHANPGQFLVTITGEKNGFGNSQISTAFAVTDKGSSKCSGSDCK